MHRMAILGVAAAALLILLTATQLALPPILAKRVESELTKHGGHARVHLSALPAPRLLFKEGDSLKVRATGLVTAPADPNSQGTLADLDCRPGHCPRPHRFTQLRGVVDGRDGKAQAQACKSIGLAK